MVADATNMTVARPYPLTCYVPDGYGADSGANLATAQPGERASFGPFAVSGSLSGYFRFDAGVAVTVSQVALLYTDLEANEQVQILASNTADFSSAVAVSIGVLDAAALTAPAGYRHYLATMIGNPVSYRYWQVELMALDGQGSAHPARTAGVFAIGSALQVEFNPDYGSTSWGYEEAPEPDRLDSGVSILDELPAAPYFEFSMTWTSEEEMEFWWNNVFGALQWRRQPVLLVRRPDPGAQNYHRHSGIYWGVLRLQPYLAAAFDLFEVNGKIRSLV